MFERTFDIIVKVTKVKVEIMFKKTFKIVLKKTFEIIFNKTFEIVTKVTKTEILKTIKDIVINKAIVDIMTNFLKIRLIQSC